jgi:hypothetical protein
MMILFIKWFKDKPAAHWLVGMLLFHAEHGDAIRVMCSGLVNIEDGDLKIMILIMCLN